MQPELEAIAKRYWEAVLTANPSYATYLGDRRFDTEIEDLSHAAEISQRQLWTELRDSLADLELETRPLPERVTAALIAESLNDSIEAIDQRMIEFRCDQMDGVASGLISAAGQFNAPTDQNAWDLVERHRKIPSLLDTALERFREGLASGRTQPRVVLERAVNQVEGFLASKIEDDPFVTLAGPEDWTAEARWRSELAEVASTAIRPALARYAEMLRTELLPHARGDDEAGLCALEGGADLYAYAIRANTGLPLPPEDLHQIGLDELAAIDEQIIELGSRMFGSTDLQAIFESLRSDPALRYDPSRPDEPLEDARACVERAAALMGNYFGRLPQGECLVKPVPEVLAADAPAAYYYPPAADGSRPGTYFVNTHDAGERNRFDTASVAFHEAIPGHHLQLAIATELTDLPDCQRFGHGSTAYVEGWALYTERLADEMGLYLNDLDRVGMLVNDAWRAARLVVDTGLHAFGWTRQQAIDLMVSHMPVGVDEITVEVDRYLAIPGQALSYKVGQREILRLRAEASEALGDKFDLSGFHDAVLGSSTVSLSVLGLIVADWVAQQA